jgi:sigma-B regulation protein RsbU (phosphoserine phosphatase)
MDTLFERRFELDWPVITEIRQVLKHVLGALSVSQDQVDAAGLVCTEYLTNLIRHNQGSDKSIMLRITQPTNDQFELTVIDELAPYNLFEHNDSTWRIGSDELVEGGMGVELIRHYFSQAQYCSVAHQNFFSFKLTEIDKRPTVIYIEDDVAQLVLMKAYLKDKYRVVCCETIEAGWQAILTANASILLLDHQLKQGTCEPLLEKLNQSNLKSELSVVMLTGDDSDEVIRKINRLGVDDYLIKPVKKNKLLQSIERVTHRFAYLSYQTAFESAPQSIHLTDNKVAHLFGSISLGNGGDFFMPLNEEGTAFVLGDMMGHGLQALKESFAIKGFISGFMATGLPYQDMLGVLNNALYNQQLCKSSLVTLIICYVENNTLFWLNAGHPSPVVITHAGDVKQLEGTGPLLGLSKDHVFAVNRYDLTKVDHTLLYTDGWSDNRFLNKDEMQELQKLVPATPGNNLDFAQTLWKNSQVMLSKEIDDASLVVIN